MLRPGYQLVAIVIAILVLVSSLTAVAESISAVVDYARMDSDVEIFGAIGVIRSIEHSLELPRSHCPTGQTLSWGGSVWTCSSASIPKYNGTNLISSNVIDSATIIPNRPTDYGGNTTQFRDLKISDAQSTEIYGVIHIRGKCDTWTLNPDVGPRWKHTRTCGVAR